MSPRFTAAVALLAFTALSCEPIRRADLVEPEVAEVTETHDRASDEWMAQVVAWLAGERTGLAPDELEDLARAIHREARTYGLAPALVLGVMHVESRYNNFAVSPVGARGLMQVLPSTGRALAQELGVPWQGPDTLFDPQVNLRLGVAYLAEMWGRYGDLSTALAAYNCGPGCVDTRLRQGRQLPRGYALRVMAAYGDHDARLGAL